MKRTEYLSHIDQYINALPSMERSEQTIKAYAVALLSFSIFLKENGIEEITPLSVVAWRTDLAEKDTAANTVRQYLLRAHTFFAWCVRMNVLNENPVLLEEIPQPKAIEYSLMELNEIESVLESNPKNINRKTACRNRAIVILLIQVGLRNSELRSLTPCDLHYEQNTITVRHGKGDKRREVAFPSLAQEAVKEYLKSGIRPRFAKDTDPLFGTDADEHGHSTGGKLWKELSSAALRGIVKRYVKNTSGKEDAYPHLLRHAYASLCDHKNVPLRQIQLTMGHSSPATTDRIYISILDKGKAAQTVNEAFNSVF